MPERARALPLLGLAALALGPVLLEAESPRDRELVVRSLELFRRGDCAGAGPLLLEVLGHAPKDIAVRKLLGRCFLKDQRWEDARVQFQRVLDLAPHDAAALDGLRAAVAEIQKQEQIRQTLDIEGRESVEEKFKASHAFQEAEELIKANRLAEAERILVDVVKRYPDSAPASERLAEICSTTKRFEEAAALYRTLAARPGASSLYLLRLAENLAWNASYDEAAKNYQLYLAEKADDLDGRLGLANALALTGHCPEAVPEFGRVLAARPKDLYARLGLARCYDQLAQPDKALEAYEHVLELNPKAPGALQARAQYTRYFDELARRRGVAAAEQGDFEGAARSFEAYLQKHPDSNETVLQAARAWSWAKRVPEAERQYAEYLRRAPRDQTARRELAKMELWAKSYAAARRHFQDLVEADPAATPEDWEGLVHAHTWDGDLAGAEPHARRLEEIAPGNAVAAQALGELRERRRLEARTAADELAAAGKLREAGDAYRRYLESYGRNQQIELQICRIWAATKEHAAAARAYRNYLRDYPQDTQARLELARALSDSRQFAEAEAEYRAVLGAQPESVPALLGLAQVMDYRGDDRKGVLGSYQRVLSLDPGNAAARQKADEIHADVAPALAWNERGFTDTDGLRRSVTSLEATFSLTGRVRLTPFYRFGYFRQLRRVPGASPEVESLNRAIEGRDGTTLSNGGGARLEASSASGWSLLAEAAAVHFDSGESSLNARAQLAWRTRSDKTAVVVEYVRRDAVHDVDNGASLVQRVMGDTVAVAWRQSLPLHLLGWVSLGGTAYSAGVDPRFASDTQRRLSARLELELSPSNRLGYFYRYSSFDERSPLYFSPSSYQTHGLTLTLGREPSKRFRVALDGDAGYSRIDGSSNIELSLRPSLAWRITPRLPLRAGYRYARSRTSFFGSRTYGAQAVEVSLARIF